MKDAEWRAFLGHNFSRLILPISLILIGGCILFFIVFPLLENINNHKFILMQREMELKELVSLYKRYAEIQQSNEKIKKRITKGPEGFELLSYLEEVSKSVGISDKISSMKPFNTGDEEVSASVVLRDLDMDELITYLNTILNSGKLLLIKKLHLRVLERGQRSLEASFIISTLQLDFLLKSIKPKT